MTQSYIKETGWMESAVRSLCGLICKGIFNLLDVIYQIFFNVASSDIFNNEGIVEFFSRIQLILGVFMVFQLAMIIMRGIIEPDSIMGNPKKGQPSVILRIVTALAMLVLVIPLNLSNTSNLNEFEEKVNKSGLLFGTLYSLQYRVIQNNTFGRLILGATDDESGNYLVGNNSVLKQSSHDFTMGVLKSFIKVNLVDESELTEVEDGDYASLESNRLCPDIDNLVDIYNDPNSSINQIIDLAEETCTTSLTKKYYAFTFDIILALPIGILFVFLFLSFTVDIAIRSIKLAILRLISPIPIISYMDPKGSKDSAFTAWTGLVTSTYLDLFFRVGIVYFVIFVINNMMGDSFTMIQKNGPIGVISQIIIWIGLLAFAKEAPKFFYQAFGIKGDPNGGNIFGGLSKAMAVGAFATSGVKTGLAHASAALREINENDEETGKHTGLGRRFFAAAGGLAFGGLSGYGSAGTAAITGKQLDRQGINKAVNENIANRRAGNTMFRRVRASVGNTFGYNEALRHSREDADLKMITDRSKHVSDWIDSQDYVKDAMTQLELAKNSGDASLVMDAEKGLKEAKKYAFEQARSDSRMGAEISSLSQLSDRYGFTVDDINPRTGLPIKREVDLNGADGYGDFKKLTSEASEISYENSTSYRRRRSDAPYVAGGTAPNNGKK